MTIGEASKSRQLGQHDPPSPSARELHTYNISAVVTPVKAIRDTI